MFSKSRSSIGFFENNEHMLLHKIYDNVTEKGNFYYTYDISNGFWILLKVGIGLY